MRTRETYIKRKKEIGEAIGILLSAVFFIAAIWLMWTALWLIWP